MSIELVGLVLTFIGTIAGIIQAWLAWKQASQDKQRRLKNNQDMYPANSQHLKVRQQISRPVLEAESNKSRDTDKFNYFWLASVFLSTAFLYSVLAGNYSVKASLKFTYLSLISLFFLAAISSFARATLGNLVGRIEGDVGENLGLGYPVAFIGFVQFSLIVLASGNGTGWYKPGEVGNALVAGLLGAFLSFGLPVMTVPMLLNYFNRLQVFLILLAVLILPFSMIWIIAVDQNGGLDSPLFR